MIELKERGILIFSKISSENNLYLKFLTQKDEIITGLSFGGSTKKKKNIFQIGYFLNIVIKNKNKNFPNSISAELSKPYYHNIFNDKYKLHALLTLVSLLNISIIEGQKVSGLFKLSENIIEILANEKKWIINYFIYPTCLIMGQKPLDKRVFSHHLFNLLLEVIPVSKLLTITQ